MNLEERKTEYDALWRMMAQEFEYLAEHRRPGMHMCTADDIGRWKEFNRRCKALEKAALVQFLED